MSVPAVVTVTRIARSPRMDGQLSDRIWQKASVFKAFKGYGGKCKAKTTCRLCYDDRFLYIGWQCQEEQIERLACWHTETIGSDVLRPLEGVGYSLPSITSRDDYVQVLLDTKHEKKSYFEFLVNPIGRVYTALGRATKHELDADDNWKCPGLKVLTHIGDKAWSVEMAIPFSALGAAKGESGRCFGVNLRRQRRPSYEIQALELNTFAWSTQQTNTMVFIPERFGVLVLGTLDQNLKRELRHFERTAPQPLPEKARVSLRRLKAKVSSAGKLSPAGWQCLTADLGGLAESCYWSSFGDQKWILWQTGKKPDDDVGLMPPEPRPPRGCCGLKKLNLTARAGGYSRSSFQITNIGKRPMRLSMSLAGVRGKDSNPITSKVLELTPEGSATIQPRQTRRIVVGINTSKLAPGKYECVAHIQDRIVPVTLDVGPAEIAVRSATRRISRHWRLPKVCKREFWMMLDPMWRKPGIADLDFVRESGLSIILMSLDLYLQRFFQVCVRELELYMPHSTTNAARFSTPIGSGQPKDAAKLVDGDTTEAGIFASGRYPVEGWFGLDFQGRLQEIAKMVIHHGRTFGRKVSGRKVDFLNVARDFVVQYWDQDDWKDAPNPNAHVENNHDAVTVLQFDPPILTRRIRVYVMSQSFSGIDYSGKDLWKWWVESGDYVGPRDPRRHDVDIMKDRLWESFSFERHFNKAPFTFGSLLLHHGKELVEYDHSEEDVAYESLKKRFKDTFLGFFVHEWDSSLTHLASGIYSPGKWLDHPTSLPRLVAGRQQAHDELEKTFKLIGRTTHDNFFAENCYKCWDHYALEWGGKYTCIELTQSGNPSYQIQIAFARGAARQYRRMWIAYLALYLGPSHPYPLQLDASNEHVGMAGSVLTGGCSPSAYYRTMIVCYMAGCSLMYHENHILSRTFFNSRQGRFRLAPHGKAVQTFHRFAKRHPDRGVTYTPVGILLDYLHGWTVPYVTGDGFGVGSGRNVWLKTPYGKSESMITEFMRTLFPWSVQRRERMGHFLTNTPYGDIFDVIVPNPPSGPVNQEVLGSYGALILLGDIRIDSVLADRLLEYVHQGGTLVTNRIHAKYFRKKLKKLPLLTDKAGECFAERAILGKGSIIITLPPYLDASKDHIHPMTAALVARLTEQLLPVKVLGDVQYLLNRRSRSWVVTLVNNKGVYKEHGEMAITRSEETSLVDVWLRHVPRQVKEWTQGRSLNILPRGNGGVVRLFVPPGDVRVVELIDP